MPLLYKTVTGSAGAALGLTILSTSIIPSRNLKLIRSLGNLGIRNHRFFDRSFEVYVGLLP
jgi:hypothetical protein